MNTEKIRINNEAGNIDYYEQTDELCDEVDRLTKDMKAIIKTADIIDARNQGLWEALEKIVDKVKLDDEMTHPVLRSIRITAQEALKEIDNEQT